MAKARTSLRHTYAEYLTWRDETRRELIHGTVYVMSPAPNRAHQALSMALSAQLFEQLNGHTCEAYAAPFDVRLAESGPTGEVDDDQVDTVVQPDLAVICDPNKLDERGCRGAPDWVIEILSPATASHDHVRKRELYEQHGVREYWLVHPVDRVVTIYRQSDEGQSFDAAITLATDRELSPAVLPEVVIDWQKAFARVPPPAGG